MVGFLSIMMGCLVLSISYVVLRLSFSKRLRLEARLDTIIGMEETVPGQSEEVLKLPLRERLLIPMLRSFGRRLQSLAPSALKVTLAKRLGQAGMKVSAEQWAGWYMVSAAAGFLLALLMGGMGRNGIASSIFLGLLMGGVGALLPELILRQRVTKRQKAIARALPDVLDLLTVSVKAGLGFDSALMKVIEKMKGPLPQELGHVLHEMKMGVMRKDALKSLAERTGVGELQSFVGTIIQADQLGASISNVLGIQSETMREKRRQAAEEQAMKAPVKMLFPLILFIFPTLFIVLLGPAMLQIMTQLFR